MKFKFSLDPVLKVRNHKKKAQKQKLAEEMANKREILELRKQIQIKLKGFLENTEQTEIQNVHMVRQRGSHIQQVHQKMKKLSKELCEAEKNVSKARHDLAEAHKNLHIIEKVKEFEKSIFNDNVAKQEQKFMDEIATQSFSR
ncbi:flagellar export protein FliJ [Gracilimonas sp. Q87]|uniref:flagellar export protein FliJ n=1 Tax=Gracilimonas sp. Q87 TaxID=3384766 RepID=UPI0039845E7C